MSFLLPSDPPTHCAVCRASISQPTAGRPRRTCSHACRQRRYRRSRIPDYDTARWNADDRRAEATLRQLEKRFGPIDDSPPSPGVPGLRYRLFYRLVRGIPLHYCAWCGKPFIENDWGTLVRGCSRSCRDHIREFKAALIRALDDFLYDPRFDERLMVRLRIAEEAEALGDPISLHRMVGLCAHCGIPFPMYAPNKRFCSKICRQRAYRARRRRCLGCGRLFKRDLRNGWKQRYCSRPCRVEHARRLPPLSIARTCALCGAPFTADRHNYARKKYCTNRCARRAADRARRLREKNSPSPHQNLPFRLPSPLVERGRG